MFDPGCKFTVCHAIASQFVGHDYSRHILETFQQPPKESLRCPAIPSCLNEDVQYDAVLIHGTPKIMLHPLDPDEHLIQMPLVTGSRTTTAQAFGKTLAKFLAPAPNGLMGDDDATLRQQELNISKAEAEDMIQPDSVSDDLGRKAVSVVRIGRGFHAASLSGL